MTSVLPQRTSLSFHKEPMSLDFHFYSDNIFELHPNFAHLNLQMTPHIISANLIFPEEEWGTSEVSLLVGVYSVSPY